MRSPIGLYLAEFRSGPALAPIPEPADLAPFELGLRSDTGLMNVGLPALPPPEMEAALSEALPDEPGPDLSEIVAALEADHAAALVEARQQWVATEAEVLSRRLDEAVKALEDRLAETLAPLLEPFLVRAAQLRALDELRDAIRTLLSAGQETITVAGPADLLAALDAAHPGEPRLALSVADTPDVTATVGDTAVRSRLQAWAATLQASLGGAS